MSAVHANGLAEASIAAVVTRCRCGAPESHRGAVCPRGAARALGVVSFYHRSPLRCWAWRAGKWLQRWAEGGTE